MSVSVHATPSTGQWAMRRHFLRRTQASSRSNRLWSGCGSCPHAGLHVPWGEGEVPGASGQSLSASSSHTLFLVPFHLYLFTFYF